MFKTQFNSLYVSIMDYVLDENNNPTFDNPEDEISYYKNVVDEYNVISFNVSNIKTQLDENSDLYNDVVSIELLLKETLEKYKVKSAVVRAYLNELSTTTVKNNFADKLYRFEQSLVTEPLIKVDVNEIQNVLSVATIYTENSSTYYYFANNPFETDNEFNVIIPIKYSFDTAKQMLTSVYNYMYGLYNTYLELKHNELLSLNTLESIIENTIYEFNEVINNAKKNKFYATAETTAEEYYTQVVNLKKIFDNNISNIVNLGVYRFTRLTTLFETVSTTGTTFISEYESNDLYVSYANELLFDSKLNKLAEYIIFIEDGEIKVDIDYIITDITLKELVEEIIALSKIVKKKFIYTQKYHESGNPTTLEFEFYQSELFLTSIKAYYYNLMSNNIYRYSNISIDDFGDSNVDYSRERYKEELAKYNKYISLETNYLNSFEFNEYYKNVVAIQNKLKNTALIFFEGATKTSPATYATEIEKYYIVFLNKLDQDLINIKKNRIDDVLEITDENKIESRKRLISFNEHVTNIENVLVIAEKYIFLGLNEYIYTEIYTPSKTFLEQLKDEYNKENYLKVLEIYNDFYINNIINFNLLYAFEKISESVNSLFSKIDIIDDMYIDEYTNDYSSTNFQEYVDTLRDLFNDETFKVTRNELFSKLDIVYDFVISTKPNQKVFFTNEKNLKKLYLDNQFMKINYIRWYHEILVVLDKYRSFDKNLITNISLFTENKDFIENFTHKDKINTLIIVQNKVLSEIKKTITDSSIIVNYNYINFSNDLIKNIEAYNYKITEDFNALTNVVNRLEKLIKISEIDNKKLLLENEHTLQWVNIIVNNTIADPEQVSYNDLDLFTGSIPYTVELEAKLEISLDAAGDEIEATYKWYIDSVIKEGISVSYTFYEEGEHTVRCEITYSTGESFSRYIKFNLTGAQNASVVKSGNIIYAPLSIHPEQPKITYIDPTSGEYITVPIYTDGNITDMIKDGSIVCEKASDDLFEDRVGLVIVGFNGQEFAGTAYDYTKIFESSTFEYPSIYEFLFDFKISTPLSGNVTIDIQDSKFTTFMAKVPDAIESVYEIGKASEFISVGTNIKVSSGDRILLRNSYTTTNYTSVRYAIVEIKNIRIFTEPEETATDGISKYYYEVEMNYFVNTSLNQYDRDEFKPEETSIVVPTLVFKTDVRELFNSLILRLEEINTLRDKIESGDLDTEEYESTLVEIQLLEDENNGFYLFEELDKIKSKYFYLNAIYKQLFNTINVDTTLSLDELDTQIEIYEKHINETKTFQEYMNDVDAYDFRQNIIDLGILVKLYKDQQTILEILISTYEYKQHDLSYFSNKLSEIKLFDTSNFIDATLSYGKNLINIVLHMRKLLFKLKTIINYPIMTDGKYIIMTSIYYRLKKNMSTGAWNNVSETDLFLLNKKLELRFGYEIEKRESGFSYKDFVSDVVDAEKDMFGRGLSTDDIKDISTYIQTIETKTIEEYDDFFMIPFWIDYLTKNV